MGDRRNHNTKRNSNDQFQLQVTKGNPSLVPPAENRSENGSVNNYFLSNVDDVFTIIRIIYCFKSDGRRPRGNNESAVEVIRDALAKVLVHYYPLAGRVVVSPEGRPAVDCTGEGAVFVEAETDCGLGEVDFSKPLDGSVREKLVVYDLPGVRNKFEIPLIAQVTKFKCGGFTIGVSFNHILADGQAMAEFVNSWGEIARGLPISVLPFLDRTILRARTPPRIEFRHYEFEPLQTKSSTTTTTTTEEEFSGEMMTYKYIQFTPEMIKRAKSSATEAATTTYEAISAFVWRARNRALKMAPDQSTRLLLVVNTRAKFQPPLPRGYFGNAITFAAAESLVAELIGNPLSYAVAKVQEAMRRVSDEQLRSVIDYCEVTRSAKRPSGYGKMTCSTSSRVPFSAADFGWGEPVPWLMAETPSYDNALLMDHPTEKGSLNLFIALPVLAMARFEELVEEELCHTLGVRTSCEIHGLGASSRL